MTRADKLQTTIVCLAIVASALVSACSKGEDKVTFEHMLDLGRLPSVDDATWAGKSNLLCVATRKTICTFQKCTTTGDVRTLQRINPAARLHERCDRGSGRCETLKPVVAHSGIWTTLADPVHSATLRVTARGDFFEYLAQNDDVYVYRGTCRSVVRCSGRCGNFRPIPAASLAVASSDPKRTLRPALKFQDRRHYGMSGRKGLDHLLDASSSASI